MLANRIVEVGRIRSRGRQEVDAEGHVVTPGFIDAHTHFDAQIFWDPLATSSCWHGVTTMVMGHCGFSLAPARRDARDLVTRNLERAEDIPAEAMEAGIDWNWESFPEYLTALEKTPKGVNVAASIGHSALRTWAMGERAFEEASTEDDLIMMERAMKEAMSAGSIGFSTSRHDFHQTSDDRPVASRIATWPELVRLVSAMGEAGDGIFQLASERAIESPDDDVRNDYWKRLIALTTATRVRTAFGASARTDALGILDLLDEIAAAGGRPIGLCHSRGISQMLSFETGLPFDRLPAWHAFRSQPLPKQKIDLRDPSIRGPLVRAAQTGDYGTKIVAAEARPPRYDRMYPLQQPLPPHETIADMAASKGIDPVEMIIDLALDHDLRLFFVQPSGRYEPENLIRVMRHPRTVMTFSDSGAHATQVADSSIQTYLLSYWVRERQEFSLEEAVRMISFDLTSTWGFYDRGLLRPGFVADINVFDPKTIAPDMPELVADLPGGARRIIQRSTGFLATIVGGQVVLDEGKDTGALPGELLRGAASSRA